jgi:hypothetical protein
LEQSIQQGGGATASHHSSRYNYFRQCNKKAKKSAYFNAGILFVTGDGSIWAKTNYWKEIVYAHYPRSIEAPNIAFQRCVNGTEDSITRNVLYRKQDYYISIADGTHMDGVNNGLTIWGETNASGVHAHLKDTHGGVNVYIHPAISCELEDDDRNPVGVFILIIQSAVVVLFLVLFWFWNRWVWAKGLEEFDICEVGSASPSWCNVMCRYNKKHLGVGTAPPSRCNVMFQYHKKHLSVGRTLLLYLTIISVVIVGLIATIRGPLAWRGGVGVKDNLCGVWQKKDGSWEKVLNFDFRNFIQVTSIKINRPPRLPSNETCGKAS